jgi:hypothetical protein
MHGVNVQLIDLHAKTVNFLIFLVDRGLELLNGTLEILDSGLESIYFTFVLTAFNLEHAQLVDHLILL